MTFLQCQERLTSSAGRLFLANYLQPSPRGSEAPGDMEGVEASYVVEYVADGTIRVPWTLDLKVPTCTLPDAQNESPLIPILLAHVACRGAALLSCGGPRAGLPRRCPAGAPLRAAFWVNSDSCAAVPSPRNRGHISLRAGPHDGLRRRAPLGRGVAQRPAQHWGSCGVGTRPSGRPVGSSSSSPSARHIGRVAGSARAPQAPVGLDRQWQRPFAMTHRLVPCDCDHGWGWGLYACLVTTWWLG